MRTNGGHILLPTGHHYCMNMAQGENSPMFFKPEDIVMFAMELNEAGTARNSVIEQFVLFPYHSATGEEHGKQGFSRRLSLLHRCIVKVFATLPPELDEIPSKEATRDAEIAIQAFVMNVFGCIENLAWIWASEKEVKQTDGTSLEPKMVGFGKNNKLMRKSMRPVFRRYLLERREWFEHIKDFRDALAHRIPLYIPPYVVNDNDIPRYTELQHEADKALNRREPDEYDRLKAEQRDLCVFRPVMKHSFLEENVPVFFHAQLLADFKAVVDLAEKFLAELAVLTAARTP